MRVLLLGAGASKSYGDSPTHNRMPIARDFFSTFFDLEISANPWVLRDGLIYYLQYDCGIDNPDEYLLSGVDIEAIHSEIASKLIEAAGESDQLKRIQHAKTYTQLIFLFAATLNEIANGPVSRSHLNLAQFLDPEDIIVTFNWDTLMERALMEGGRWRLEDGYGVEPHSIFRDGWKKPEKLSSGSAPKLLKLHGSTNWLTAYTTYEEDGMVLAHTLPPESLFVYDHASRPYSTYAGRYMDGYGPLTYGYYPPNLIDVPGRSAPNGYVFAQMRPKFPWMPEGKASTDGLVSMPLIIPPVHEKSYELFGGLFEGLWSQAQGALEACDEVIVIGYSFPRTDLQSHALFSNAFLKRSSLPHVTIIDPAPARAAEKFRMDLGIPATHLRVFDEPFEGGKTLTQLSRTGPGSGKRSRGNS